MPWKEERERGPVEVEAEGFRDVIPDTKSKSVEGGRTLYTTGVLW